MAGLGSQVRKNDRSASNPYVMQQSAANASPNAPTHRAALAQIIQKGQESPELQLQLQAAYMAEVSNPSSPIYNPYTQATTNSTAKTYELNTQKAESEWASLQNELRYWVNRTDRNYSDEEILSKIDMSKYSTLQKMDEGRLTGYPYALTRPVGYSEDAMYGVLWSARNNDQTSGDYLLDAVQRELGRGNLSPENTRANKADAALETYAPYAAGSSVITDKYAYQLGLTGDIDQKWLDDNFWMSSDPNYQPIYTKLYNAEKNTQDVETALAEWNNFVERQIASGEDPEKIFSDETFETFDNFKPIKKLLEGQMSGKLVETTRALDFDWNEQKRRAQESYQNQVGEVEPEVFESEVSESLKSPENVPKQEGFFKRVFGKVVEDVRGMFGGEETEAEAVALKTDDGSYDDVRDTVAAAIDTSEATTEDLRTFTLSNADAFAVKHLLPTVQKVRELEEKKKAIERYQAFYDKWMPEFEKDPFGTNIYNNPDYINESHAIQADMEVYDQYGGDASSIDAELNELRLLEREVLQNYAIDNAPNGYDDTGDTVLPLLSVIDSFSGYTDEDFRVLSYDWQDKLNSGEANWETTRGNIDQLNKQYSLVIDNIDTAIAVAEQNGLEDGFLDGLRAYKRSLQTEQEAFRVAKLRDNADFSKTVEEFNKNYSYVDRPTYIQSQTAVYSKADIIKDYISNPSAATAKHQNSAGNLSLDNIDFLTALSLLTDDEKNAYKYLYLTEGKEKATEYISALEDTLNYRGYSKMTGEMADADNVAEGIANNALSVLVNASSIGNVYRNAIDSLSGEGIDPYSPKNWGTAFSGAVRESTKQDIDNATKDKPLLNKVLNLGYDATMTAADSMVSSMAGGGFGQIGGLTLMAASAAQNSLVDVKLRGGSDTQAWLMAGSSAIVETATEFLPLDNLFDTFEKSGKMGVRDLIGQIFKGTVSDAPGEMISEALGGISDDLIMQELSAAELRINQLMEENGVTRAEAEEQVNREAITDILYAGLLSTFSTAGQETASFGFGKLMYNVTGQKSAEKLAEARERADKANKLASGQYTTDFYGNLVPKTPARQLSTQERARMALESAGRDGVGLAERAASVSAVLQRASGADAFTADAVAKAFVSKFSRGVTFIQRVYESGTTNATAENLQAFMIEAVTNPESEAAYLADNMYSDGFGYNVDRVLNTITRFSDPARITEFLREHMIGDATISALKGTDLSNYGKARKKTEAAKQKAQKATSAYNNAQHNVGYFARNAETAKAEFLANPADDNKKSIYLKWQEAAEQARRDVEPAKTAYEAALKEEQEAKDELKAVASGMIVNARHEAATVIEEYMKSKAAVEQERQVAVQEQVEADNLSEMEFQNFVEETAPNATPEQTEAMREGFKKAEKQKAARAPATPEEAQLTKTQRTAKALGKRFGLEVEFSDLGDSIDGGYDSTNNKLILNSRLTQDKAIIRTVAHELTHKSERGGFAYDTFATALLDIKYGGNRKQMNADIRERLEIENAFRKNAAQMQDSSTYGMDLKPIKKADARKEIVADIVSDILYGDETLIEQLVEKDIDTAYTFFDRLKDALKRLVGIKGSAADQLNRTRELFEKALAKAAEKGVKTTAQKVAESQHPASVQFSLDQWAKATGFQFQRSAVKKGGYEIVDQDGNTVDKVTKGMMVNTPAGRLVTTALGKGNMTATEADGAYQFLADVMNMVVEFEDQETVWEMVGSALFSSVKNNSDKQYGRTVDYGTICSKTRDIVNVMSEAMLEKGRGLTREEVIMAYNKTFNEGMSVPCPPCYVFSRWMGVPSLLETMRKGQERFANATDDDVNDYVNGVKERYASELTKTKKSGEKKTLSEVMGTRKTNILKKLDAIRQEVASERFDESSLDKVREQQKALEAELEDIELYNWVTQVLCETDSKGKPIEKNGKVSIDKKFKAVPNEVLLDMRRTGEFAGDYAKAWKFRTTRGAGMGKAQLPYAGAEIGDVLTGAKRWSANANPFYTGDEAKAKRALTNASKRTTAQNLIGGNRFQSTSDFRPEWGLDYLMTFFEMQAIGAKGQLYTKVIEAVDLFASAGVEVNLSVMAKGDGWHLDENGNPVITLEDFSSVTGIDAEQAMKKTQEYDNVQLILVGMNNTHIELALADSRISFVIPWHSSGNSKEALGQMMEAVGESRGKAQDYSEYQTDKIGDQTPEQKAAWDLRKKILTGGFFVKGKAVEPTDAEMATIAGNEYLSDLYERMYLDPQSDAYHVKLSPSQASQIFPHEYWDTNSTYDTADVNGQRFVEYCKSMGIEPRFPQFADKKGYWKLLIDRRMYGRDGKYRPAGYINASNVKINELPQNVSQAKPGTSEQIQRAKQALLDDIDARTAEKHQYNMTAEHAAPKPAVPAKVQFSLSNKSRNDLLAWDDSLTLESNIDNLPEAKRLDAEISEMRQKATEMNAQINKMFGSLSSAKKLEFLRSDDPLAVEFKRNGDNLSSAISTRSNLIRMFSKDARNVFSQYRSAKQKYDEAKAKYDSHYYNPEPFADVYPKVYQDYVEAKKEYDAKFVPELEKLRDAEAKRLEREEAKKAAERKVTEPVANESPVAETPVESTDEATPEPVAVPEQNQAADPVAETETPVEEDAPEPEQPNPQTEPTSSIYADAPQNESDDYGQMEEKTSDEGEPSYNIPEPPEGYGVRQSTVTMLESEEVPEWAKTDENLLKPELIHYEKETNKEQTRRAWNNINTRGAEAEYLRLMQRGTNSAEDVIEVQILMKLFDREDTADAGKFMALAAKYVEAGTEDARNLQARKLLGKKTPTGAKVWIAGKAERDLSSYIEKHPGVEKKINETAQKKANAVKGVVGENSLDDVSADNKWRIDLNKAQIAAIEAYGLENVERAGIFYNRATVKQRMLEAIIQTKDPFADTGFGLNLFQRLEYMKHGQAVLTNADLNYIARNLGEYVHFGSDVGSRIGELAVNRAYEAWGNIKPASGMEKLKSYRYIGMLLSGGTFVRNIIGNASLNALSNLSHDVEVGLDALIGLKTGERTKALLTFKERVAGWEAFVEETQKTFSDYFIDKVDTNPKNDPFNTHRKGRVYQSKTGEAARNVQSFMMSVGDRNFWKRAYVNSLAEMQKLSEQGKLKNELGQPMTQEEIVERAKHEADYATLSENNLVSDVFGYVAMKNPVVADVLSIYMPFTGVPTNVVKRGIEYSPLNFVWTLGRAGVMKAAGKRFNQRQFVEGLCRPLTGAGVIALGAALFSNGLIKMGTGDDEEEGNQYYDARTALGDQFSAYMEGIDGETNVGLNMYGNVGTLMLFGAALTSELQKEDATIGQAVWNAINHNVDSLVDSSFLSGITDLFDANAGDTFGERAANAFMENVASQSIPSFVAKIAESCDPYVRDTKDKNKIVALMKSVMNRIPGLRNTLPKKVSVAGTAYQTREHWIANFIDPATRTNQYDEPELEEAMRLRELASDEDKNAVLPSDLLRGSKNTFQYNKATYELNDEQKEAFKFKYGEIWTGYVAETMADPGYEALTEAEKIKVFKKIMSKSKIEVKKWFIETYGGVE